MSIMLQFSLIMLDLELPGLTFYFFSILLHKIVILLSVDAILVCFNLFNCSLFDIYGGDFMMWLLQCFLNDSSAWELVDAHNTRCFI